MPGLWTSHGAVAWSGKSAGMEGLSLPAGLPSERPFTAGQAHEAGIDDTHLLRMVRDGALRRPLRGVYVPAVLPDSLALRCQAVRLVLPGDAFLCDHTAAWMHVGDRALPPGDHLGVPELSCFVRREGARLRRGSIRSGERDVRPEDLVEVHGIPVTSPLRTALDLGRLARNNDVKLHGLDSMLSTGAFTHEELLASVPRFAGQRGIVALRVLAPLADGGSQSFGETVLRLRWVEAGLPKPVTQHEVRRPDGSSYFIDMALPELPFGGEYDGFEFHSSEEQVEHDRMRRSWLRSERHWTIEVFVRDDVHGPSQTAGRRLRATYELLLLGQRKRRYL